MQKPLMHLHTQFNRDIPWETIDMDFMNLNQSAHGDREFGFIMSRMRLNRKVVVGHWEDPEVLGQVGAWSRILRARSGDIEATAPPDRNEEYLFFQMLVGSWPMELCCGLEGLDAADGYG